MHLIKFFNKKVLLIFCALILLHSPVYGAGESRITEIMYDAQGSDTDHEWIEIQNITNASIDITGWKLNDGTNHVLNVPPENGGTGSMVIPAGSYAIIASAATQFLADFPSFSGTLIDTSMSLSNTTDTIKIIKDSGEISTEITYSSNSGGGGDGTALQYSSGAYVSGQPTPGTGYIVSSGEGSLPNPSPILTPKIVEYPISAKINFSVPTVLARVPFTVKPSVSGKYKQDIH